jgi:glycosyltransferase involved in cell wall biosynthesis
MTELASGAAQSRKRCHGLVIAWMPSSQRSATLAERLGFDLMLLGRAGFRRPWTAPFVYPVLMLRTAWTIVRRRPGAILVIAPPIVAPLLVVPLAGLARARVGIDIHSGALLDRRWRWSLPILRYLGRRADASVVTLPSLSHRMDGRIIVLPDPLPHLPDSTVPASSYRREKHDRATPTVVAIAGWGGDEPLGELAEAARDRPWNLLITGKPRHKLDVPPNVTLTGLLDPGAYADTLRRADAVTVLTTRPDTLLSGAWEGLALGKALVLSDTTALRAAFGDAAKYAGLTPTCIAAAISEALANRRQLEAKAARLADRLARESGEQVSQLLAALSPRET